MKIAEIESLILMRREQYEGYLSHAIEEHKEAKSPAEALRCLLVMLECATFGMMDRAVTDRKSPMDVFKHECQHFIGLTQQTRALLKGVTMSEGLERRLNRWLRSAESAAMQYADHARHGLLLRWSRDARKVLDSFNRVSRLFESQFMEIQPIAVAAGSTVTTTETAAALPGPDDYRPASYFLQISGGHVTLDAIRKARERGRLRKFKMVGGRYYYSIGDVESLWPGHSQFCSKRKPAAD